MSQLSNLIDTVKNTPDCCVRSSLGPPSISGNHVLPADLLEFYQLCGGMTLFSTSLYSVDIVSPQDLTQTNPILFVGVEAGGLEEIKDDISWSWYIVGRGYSSQYLSIDFAQERIGRCYFSGLGEHANPGDTPIIAESFTDLIFRLLQNKGEAWYWMQPHFQAIGDAYD